MTQQEQKPWDGNEERRKMTPSEVNIILGLSKIQDKLDNHVIEFTKHTLIEEKLFDNHYNKISELEKREDRFAEDISIIKGDIKNLNTRINGSLDKMLSFMESGKNWRRVVVLIALALFAQICTIAYTVLAFNKTYGMNQRQIEINTKRLDVLEIDNKKIQEEKHYHNKINVMETKEK